MASESDIERVVAEYRTRIANLEARYHSAVGPARRAAARRLRDELGRFLSTVEAEGVPAKVTRRWLTDHAAYQQLVAVAEAQLDAVTTEAVRAIRWRVADAAQLGKPAADDLTSAVIGPTGAHLAATGTFGQVNVGAIQQLVGQLQTSSPLRALPKLNADAVQSMQSELLRGLANGEHSRVIGRRIAQAADIPAARAATIARTEIHRAYRESNRMAYKANPMVGAWRWQADLGRRTCSACWAMSGTVHSNDEAMGSHPNCRCTQLPVVDASALRELGIDMPDIQWPTGEEEFAKQTAAVQREVLGPAKYDAYQRGDITLNDTVAVRQSDQWGTTRSTASVSDALANAA